MKQTTRAAELYARALELIPGGVNSPVRAMKAVGLDEPLFARRGEGAYLEDVEGRRYVDWVLSWGPLIFGHADPETVDWVVGLNADTLFYDLDEDDRRTEIGAWTHYWHIKDSDIQFAGVVQGVSRFGSEPENYTRESGIEFRYRF